MRLVRPLRAPLRPARTARGFAQQLKVAIRTPAAAFCTNPETRLGVVLGDRQSRHLLDELVDTHVARLGDLFEAFALFGRYANDQSAPMIARSSR